MHTVLRRQCAYLRDNGQIHENRPENTKSAVIVEPRRHELLEPVIRNVMHFLPEDWNLTVICGSDNEEWIRARLPGWKVRYMNLGVENLTPELHNRLLQQPSFWKTVHEETLLVFQTDSCLLAPHPRRDDGPRMISSVPGPSIPTSRPPSHRASWVGSTAGCLCAVGAPCWTSPEMSIMTRSIPGGVTEGCRHFRV